MNGKSPIAAYTPSTMPTDPTPLMLRGLKAGCRLTGLGERLLWSLVNRNAIPHRRVGRALMFVPEEVAAWVAAGCPTDANAADRIRQGGRP